MALLPPNESKKLKTLTRSYWAWPEELPPEKKDLLHSGGSGLDELPLEKISILPKGGKPAEGKDLGDHPAPVEILPALAHMFDVDISGMEENQDEKHIRERNAIEQGFQNHRHRGTRWAVENAVKAVYGTATVKEWFEDDGNPDPYTFKVIIHVDEQELNGKTLGLITRQIDTHKNVRSSLAGIEVCLTGRAPVHMAMGTQCGETVTAYPWQPKTLEQSGAVHVGMATQMIETVTINPVKS